MLVIRLLFAFGFVVGLHCVLFTLLFGGFGRFDLGLYLVLMGFDFGFAAWLRLGFGLWFRICLDCFGVECILGFR